MSSGNSRSISSNQDGPHEKLLEVVRKHLRHPSQKPITEHTQSAFEQANVWLAEQSGPLIIDSCCGVGESTAGLAKRFPQHVVIGLDKSALRTGKHTHYAAQQDNYCVLRADAIDFWRLAANAGWQVEQHYLLYPNPYPKSAHLQRRWHGSPAFLDLLRLGGRLEVRSNWHIYIEEFAMALGEAGAIAEAEHYASAQPDTPFERKYWASGQQSWRVTADLSDVTLPSIQ